MSSLQGKSIKDTYKSLLKTVDNSELLGQKEITDGNGNPTGVSLNNQGDVIATGKVSFGSLEGNITINKFVDEADGISANDNDSSIPTSAAVKNYIDSNVTAQDLDITDGTNNSSVDLDSQSLTFTGDTGVSATVSGQTVTFDSSQLQSNIDAEETARIAADNALQNNITTEESARSAADTDLQNQITANDGDISALDARLTTAEGDISSNDTGISNLGSRLTTAEGNITSNDLDISALQSGKQDISEKGQASGYAPLDSGAKIPITHLPDAAVGQVEYQGTWDASTDTPTLPSASTVKGHYYVVNVAGTYQSIDYLVGDWIISDGTDWQHVDNTDAVTTVFGRLGAIVANEADYSSFYPLISDLNTTNSNLSTLQSTVSSNTTKLNGIEASADVTDTANVVAALTAGSNISISGAGVIAATDTNTTYTAGGGLGLSGTTFSHSDTSTAGNLTASGRRYVTGLTFDTYGHVTGYSTGTETVVNTDTNTTYSAGAGLTLSGTTFSIQPDLRGEAYIIGRDNNDYINVETTQITFALDGAVDMRLYNNGDLHVEGNVIGYSTSISDQKFKNEVTPIESALDKVKALKGVEYTWNATSKKGKKDLGFIAQEVEEVLPEIITEVTLSTGEFADNPTQSKTIDYEKITAVLVEAMKEQQKQIDELKAKLDGITK